MLVQALEPRRLLAAELVADLDARGASSNPGGAGGASTPPPIVDVGGVTYFAATHQNTGTELWRTDGTEAGTFMVKDINPGVGSTDLGNLTNVDGTLFFVARANTGYYELYKSDGTAGGTTPIGQIMTYYGGADFRLTAVGSTLYFVARSFGGGPQNTTGDELWKTDGTAAGTSMVYDSPGYNGLDPQHLVDVGGTLYFSGWSGQGTSQDIGRELWKSDGTAAGTALVKDLFAGFQSSDPKRFTAVGGTVFFTALDASGETLWKTDGTDAGTAKVKPTGGPLAPRELTSDGDSLFFAAGNALWHSDGTDTGTAVRATFTTAPRELTAVGSSVYFGAAGGGTGLFQVSGALSPTLSRAMPVPQSIVNAGGTLYCATATNLYEHDPATAAGGLLKSLAYPTNLTASGTRAVFAGLDATGNELWGSDGTPAGTARLKDIRTDTLSSAPTNFVAGPGGTFVFLATHPEYGRELFFSDGTAAGTRLVKDINTGSGGSTIEYLVRGYDAWYFKADNGTNGHELWRTDGTPDGTRMVLDHRPGSAGGFPYNLTPLGDKLVFDAVVPAPPGTPATRATYVSSGVVGEPFVEIGPGNSPYAAEFARAGNRVFFTAGTELWVTDGTAGNTMSLGGMLASALSYNPRFTAVGDAMYFISGAGDLWRSDGTVAGTAMLVDLTQSTFNLAALGNRLFFQSGSELWQTDGTMPGTTLVATLGGSPGNLTAVTGAGGNHLYFGVGTKLYRFDADIASLAMVRDFAATGGGLGGQLVAFGGRLYFTANDGTHGYEWWTTTRPGGTIAASSGMVQEIRPGAVGTAIGGAAVVGDQLYFYADDGAHGMELWKIKPFARLAADGTLTINAADVRAGAGGGAGGAGGEIRVTGGATSGLNVFRPNGEGYTFYTDDVDAIRFNGVAGDDSLVLASVGVPLTFDGGGGSGNDRLLVSAANSGAAPLTLANDAAATTGAFSVTASSGALRFATSLRLASLAIGNADVRLAPGGDKTLVVDALSISADANGRLDLHDNDLIVRGASYAAVAALIAAARGPDGDWPAAAGGITSTTAAASAGLTTLAAAPAAAVLDFAGAPTALWNGQTVEPGTVLVKYTYGGDSNFDGKLDADDYGTIDFNVLTAGSSGYWNGDFNYDGKIDADDYGVIDFNILAQQGPL